MVAHSAAKHDQHGGRLRDLGDAAALENKAAENADECK